MALYDTFDDNKLAALLKQGDELALPHCIIGLASASMLIFASC